MKLTNGDLFAANVPLGKLAGYDFPVSSTIDLRQLINKLNEPLKLIEDVRNDLIRKHGKEGLKGSGQLEVIGPDDKKGRPMSKSFPSFLTDFNELMAKEIEVDFEKVKLPAEVEGKPLQLSVRDLITLELFVEIA